MIDVEVVVIEDINIGKCLAWRMIDKTGNHMTYSRRRFTRLKDVIRDVYHVMAYYQSKVRIIVDPELCLVKEGDLLG